jgi:two-component system KDP operon response regulator KdpE
MKRILLIGSAALPAAALAELAAIGFECGHATDAGEAIARFSGAPPDVIVMAFAQPPESAQDAISTFRALAPVLVAAEDDEPDQRIAALERGAEDVLHRNMDAREIALRIAHVEARWRKARATGEMRFDGFTFDPQQRRLRKAGRAVALSGSEARLVEFLARRRTAIVTRREIARHCLRSAFCENSRSPDMLVAKLRGKFRQLGAPRALAAVRGEGYRLMPGAALLA